MFTDVALVMQRILSFSTVARCCLAVCNNRWEFRQRSTPAHLRVSVLPYLLLLGGLLKQQKREIVFIDKTNIYFIFMSKA